MTHLLNGLPPSSLMKRKLPTLFPIPPPYVDLLPKMDHLCLLPLKIDKQVGTIIQNYLWTPAPLLLFIEHENIKPINSSIPTKLELKNPIPDPPTNNPKLSKPLQLKRRVKSIIKRLSPMCEMKPIEEITL